MNASGSFAQALAGLGSDVGARSAALLLHAVADEDRTWLLERLGPEPRAAIEALLQDLALLGLPPDPALIEDALHASGARAAAMPPEVTLAGACAEHVAALLPGEPDRLVVAVLSRAWPWRGEVLRRVEPLRRRRIEERLREGADAGGGGRRLQEALVEGLLRRLAAAEAVRPTAAPWRVLARLRQWLAGRRLRRLPRPRA